MATCNRSALMGLPALQPHKICKPRQVAARRPCRQRRPNHHVSLQVQCKTKDFSTRLTSNPGKDGGPFDESINAQNMLYLRRRIEDLKSEELRMQAQEESQTMLYLRRRIEHLKSRELMMQAKEESQLDDIQLCSSNVGSERWMKWERDYQMFYQEEQRTSTLGIMYIFGQSMLANSEPGIYAGAQGRDTSAEGMAPASDSSAGRA
ncbi:hypothetical protein GOP47_0026524 [Adiantum capillus-veneris]|nr:hypothetical protein GOP47_0026524 [Adiantum capillus-veneris]